MVALYAKLGVPIVIGNLIMLAAALAWAVVIIRKSDLNRVFAFPIIWGLSFLLLDRLLDTPQNIVIAAAAGLGIFILLGAAIIKPKNRLV